MTRKTCEWKNGRMCTMCGYSVKKTDCDECPDYKAPAEEYETVLEHLGKMESMEAATIICEKVEECHGWPHLLVVWLRQEWKP